MFGDVQPSEIILYLEKNWRTIDYGVTITKLLKMFEDSLIDANDRLQTYINMSSRFDTYSKNKLESDNGHMNNCKGDSHCDCCYKLFISPRTIIVELTNDYYAVQCPVTQIREGNTIEEVLTNLRKNWPRMDMKSTIKDLLKLIHGFILPTEFAVFQLTFNKIVKATYESHWRDPQACKESFYNGLLMCACHYQTDCVDTLKLLEQMIISYYTRWIPTKPHTCTFCRIDFDTTDSLISHNKNEHDYCFRCKTYVAEKRGLRNHEYYCEFTLPTNYDSDGHDTVDDDNDDADDDDSDYS